MENTHIVARFDKQLDQLRTRVLEMGDLVGTQISDAGDLMQAFDAEKAELLIAGDRRINGMQKSIHTKAERLIALRQPVALDLRQALLPINIAAELERIGDHAKSTAKRAGLLAEASQGQVPENLQRMSGLIQIMLTGVMLAYKGGDTELAAEIRMRDREVDTMNKIVFEKALLAVRQSPENAEPYIHAILLARSFERVGDHIVNIARHVHQIVTGEDLKAAQ